MPGRAQSARQGHADRKRAVTFLERSTDRYGRSASARDIRPERSVERRHGDRVSRSTSRSAVQRDVSFGPHGQGGRFLDPKERNRSATPSTRDRTPSTAPSPVKKSSDAGRTDVCFNDLHSTARAIHREACGARTEPVPQPRAVQSASFCRAARFAGHLTQEDREKSSIQLQKAHPFRAQAREAGAAGKRGTPHVRGKRCYVGAPHVADTEDMAKLVCGSEQMVEFWEEKEDPGMADIFKGYAGFSDQLADVQGPRMRGTRHFHGAPHVQDTNGLEKLICGSEELTQHKEVHETKYGDLSGMLEGLAGRSLQQDDDGDSRARAKKSFHGAPHVQDTPLGGILGGSEMMAEYQQRHLEKFAASHEKIFEGHAGLNLQADDFGPGQVRRKRDLKGAPHVADSQDVFDLVCGSPNLKEAHAKRMDPTLANIFDGCAGLYLQEEDIDGPRTRGKKKVPERSAYHSTVQEQCFENAFQPLERVARRSEMPQLPTLFISHGIGPLPLLLDDHHPFVQCLAEIPRKLELDDHSVRCILVISAHWETQGGLEVTLRRTHGQGLLYDYAGAPPKTYEVHQRFHPPGDAQVSGWVVDLLEAAGKQVRHNPGRSLDHGVFVPLLLMPDLVNIPVVQLSLPALSGRRGSEVARHCLEVGKALAPLRSRGVLIMGSGLSSNAANAQHVERWTEHLKRLCSSHPSQRYEGLRQWTYALPHAREVHGREEHLLPLHVVAGAALDDAGEVLGDFRLHQRAMTHFCFG